MILLFVLITFVYLFLIGYLAYGIDKVRTFQLESIEARTRFSVIIPFRNEGSHLPDLLNSIRTLNYPKHLFEIILVNDESTDNSVSLITNERKHSAIDLKLINNIRNTNSPKKDAISTAMTLAKYEWIVTTDADCILPRFWLDAFDNFIQSSDAELIVAPVTYLNSNSFLKRFQLLDFLSLQGATLGGFGIQKPFLCNGANLAYRKLFFETLNGFDGNSDVASGDDIFLLEKALKHGRKKVHYLKTEHVLVQTNPQESLKDLIAQRQRWASKTSRYKNGFAKVVGLSVFLMNAALICALILTIIGYLNYNVLGYLFIIKIAIDFLLIFKTARFFNQENVLSSYIFSCVLYPFFSVYIVVISMFFKYKWKDRAFAK